MSLKSAVRVHLRLSDRDVSVPPPVCIACLLAARPFLHLVADGSPSAHAFRVFLSNLSFFLSFSSPLLALLSAGERERGGRRFLRSKPKATAEGCGENEKSISPPSTPAWHRIFGCNFSASNGDGRGSVYACSFFFLFLFLKSADRERPYEDKDFG